MEEINISQEASLPALEDPSTADSQLQRLDRRVDNERKKKLKKRKMKKSNKKQSVTLPEPVHPVGNNILDTIGNYTFLKFVINT